MGTPRHSGMQVYVDEMANERQMGTVEVKVEKSASKTRGGVRGLQRLPSLKYYNVLRRESRFSLELKAAKNKHYIKKCFK